MPTSIKLEVGKEKHTRIVKAVCARKKLSEDGTSHLRKRWEAADEEHQIYVNERDADRLRKGERHDPKRSDGFQYVDVHVPYSYAILMSFHTYLCSVFLSRSPVLQYQGRHGESEENRLAVESLMDYQTTIGGHLPNYYVWFLDAAKYGLGINWQYWSKDEVAIAKYEQKPIVRAGIELGRTKEVKSTARIEGYEGNRTFNVRPQDYIPDTRVPLHSPNRGEFQGRKFYLSHNDLYRGKESGQYINCDQVLAISKSKASQSDDRYEHKSESLPNPSVSGYSDPTLLDDIPCVEMIVELIPAMWDLGKTQYPEKWVFVVAHDQIVIECHPYGQLHNKYPGETLEIEVDGYNLGSRGILEVAKPLNDTMNWLFNSHFYNVRKSLNGDIVYDPTRLSTKDMRDGGAGKRIRVKPEAYGEDIRKFLHIIPGDSAVTQTNMRDLQVVADIMHRVTGVADQLLGQQSQGGRKSATEVRTASTSSVNRMKTSAEYMSVMGMSPFAQLMLQTTQQNYSGEKKFRIAGDSIEREETFFNITPEAISGEWDYVAVDGTLPADNFALVNMWTNFFTQSRNFPQVAEQYDMGRIFAHIAQLGGLKDIKQFRINVGANGQPPGTIPIQELSDGRTSGGGATPAHPGRGTANGAGDTPVIRGVN